MRKLHIDIETFSKIPLRGPNSPGLYRYAAECEILLIAVAYDNFPVKLYDITKREVPERLIEDLQNPDIVKIAHNAPFELACLSNCLDLYLDPDQWVCTMSRCAMAGLPLGLGQASDVLGLSEGKDKTGDELIKLFCVPCKPSKTNGFRTRNLPEHFPEKWEQFGRYNMQDVRTEIAIEENLSFIKIPLSEKKVWAIDQIINNRGLKIDQKLVHNAIRLNNIFVDRVMDEAKAITGLQNPKSVKQLKDWLEEETEEEINNLRKESIPALLERFPDKIIQRVLNIRGELSKTSVKKYATMLRMLLNNGRICGLFQYCGAGRTWRFAGRMLQVHNFVKGNLKYNKDYDFDDLDFARMLVLYNDFEMLEMCYGPVPKTLSNLLRTAIVPEKGKRLIVSDFSAIEARILAWLAGEQWRLDIFNTHGKIYEAGAAKILKKNIEDVTRKERAEVGKISELALGYQGGVNALLRMAEKENIVVEESRLQPLVDAWRAENPMVKKFWYDVQAAAIKAINTGEKVLIQKGISFMYRRKYLVIGLPSGHSLYYYNASLIPGKFGVQIQYWGLNQTTKKWCRQTTYGGKLVENLCQAIGRDCLANALINLHEAGYETVLHVHDETVNECEEGFGSLEEVNELMIKPAPWMIGLPLKAEGFVHSYYKKD